ncbi:MAG TPA: hypothetical protein DCE44_06295, partial [Verrucomicrobiales bacterium]|nr:hypothetical protein [Verrucomicrobiales bacterium]
AVAVMCIASEGWTSEQALQWLKQAGTATNYAGLYRSVGTFERPSKETLAKVPDQFPARVEVSPLVDAMVEIDLRFDHLKLIKEAGYRQPPAHPDLSPAHEALLLQELFKELLRSTDTAARKQDYQDHLVKAEKAALDLHRILNSPVPSKDKADAAFQSLSSSCGSCHKAYRN